MGETSKDEKIWRRAGHISFEHHGEMFVWGGYTEHLSKKVKLPNTYLNKWRQFIFVKRITKL